MYEALQRLMFQAFLDSRTEDNQQDISLFFESIVGSFQQDTFLRDDIESPRMYEIIQSHELFINDMSSKSRTFSFSFWSMCIKMASNLYSTIF